MIPGSVHLYPSHFSTFEHRSDIASFFFFFFFLENKEHNLWLKIFNKHLVSLISLSGRIHLVSSISKSLTVYYVNCIIQDIYSYIYLYVVSIIENDIFVTLIKCERLEFKITLDLIVAMLTWSV